MGIAVRQWAFVALFAGVFGVLSSTLAVHGAVAADSATQDAKAVADLAKRHFQDKEYDLAARMYLRAYEMAKRPPLLFKAGRARELNGDRDEAIALYKQYIEVETDVAGREEARARLEALQEKNGEKPKRVETPKDKPEPGGKDKNAAGNGDAGKKDAAKKAGAGKNEASAKKEPEGKNDKSSRDAPSGRGDGTKAGDVAKGIETNGTWHFDKKMRFEASGVVPFKQPFGPALVEEVIVKNMPSSSDVREAREHDASDNCRPKFALSMSNKSDVKVAMRATVRLEAADGEVLLTCDRKDTVDKHADKDHTSMCYIASMKTKDWPRIAFVRVILTGEPE